MGRTHYVAASERVLEEAKRRSLSYVGDCADCKWKGAYSGGGDYDCNNPLVILASRNQTDAYRRDRIRGIQEQRDKRSMYGEVVCGPDGTLFEPRDGTPFGPSWTLFVVAAMIPPLLWFLWRLL